MEKNINLIKMYILDRYKIQARNFFLNKLVLQILYLFWRKNILLLNILNENNNNQ